MKHVTAALDVIARRWQVVVASLVIGLIAGTLLLQRIPRTFEAASHVLIVNEADGRDPSVTSVDLPSVATSSVVLGRAIERLGITTPLIDVQKAVKARVQPRSSIMEIDYRDESPDRAVSVPNAIADELSTYYGEISTQRADVDLKKLDDAIAQTRSRYESINARLATMTAENTALGSDRGFDALSSRLDELHSERELANAALQGDAAGASAVSPDSPEYSQIARHEIFSNDEYLRILTTGSSKDAAELAFDQSQYTNKLPGLAGLRAKVQAEHQVVAAQQTHLLNDPGSYSPTAAQAKIDGRKAQALVTGDQAKVKALDGLIADTASRLNALPSASAQYSWLKLQRDAAQADYLTLEGRRTGAVATRAESLSLGSVVVLDRAVRATTAVVGMGRTALSVVTAAFIVMLALGMAFLAELFDPRLRRADQIENLYGTELIVTLGKR